MDRFRNSQVQVQSQTQTLTQTLSPQQVLEAKVLELSTLEIEERVRAELNDNPALEENDTSDINSSDPENLDENPGDDYTEDLNVSDRESASDDFLTDDDVPDYYLPGKNRSPSEQAADIPYSDSVSFYDILSQQLGEQDLTDHQRQIADYIIGSIDNDGILDKSLESISNDLAIYHNLETDVYEIEEVLKIIQEFDPAGIGARNLQECLLLQIERKEPSDSLTLQKQIITDYFEEFTRKRWDKIAVKTGLTEDEVSEAIRELLKLNPRPGSSLGEAIGKSVQHIVPDFLIETFDDNIQLSLNNYNVPELKISRDFSDMLDSQINSKDSKQRDAAIYIRQKLDAAKGFIQALRQREQTLTRTMQTIIKLQRNFFLEGDESKLKPMILKDVAERTGYDISTISRATSGKYVQTNFGTFPVKSFFTDGIKTDSGEEVSVNEIHRIINEMIASEDSKNPLTDEQLSDALKKRGYIVARRTVAKYREQLGIPVARMRK